MADLDKGTEDKRRAREQKNYRSGNLSAEENIEISAAAAPSAAASSPSRARTFQQMIGVGDQITIEDVGEFGMKAYPMRMLSLAGGLIKEGPALYIAQAMLAEQEQEDQAMIADKLNQLFNRVEGQEDYYTPKSIEREMLGVLQNLTVDKIEPLLESIVMAIKLVHKDITDDECENIKDAIDHPTMIRALRIIFQLNSGLSRRF